MKRPSSFSNAPGPSSPPILFQYRQTANLAAGAYEFTLTRQALTPNRELNASSTYRFLTITASADVAEADYAGAIDVIPAFALYTRQSAGGPFLRDAVQLGKYLDNLPFEKSYKPVSSPNFFTGSIVGSLIQTPMLIGKTSITITVIFAAQEISDGVK